MLYNWLTGGGFRYEPSNHQSANRRRIKKELDSIFREMGMNMTTAFTIFAKKVARERRSPFEITAPGPFCNEENMDVLNQIAYC